MIRIVNFLLKPTGYQLVHRRYIKTRKELIATYFYGANRDEVVASPSK